VDVSIGIDTAIAKPLTFLRRLSRGNYSFGDRQHDTSAGQLSILLHAGYNL
jgi:hypothetical protein